MLCMQVYKDDSVLRGLRSKIAKRQHDESAEAAAAPRFSMAYQHPPMNAAPALHKILGVISSWNHTKVISNPMTRFETFNNECVMDATNVKVNNENKLYSGWNKMSSTRKSLMTSPMSTKTPFAAERDMVNCHKNAATRASKALNVISKYSSNECAKPVLASVNLKVF